MKYLVGMFFILLFAVSAPAQINLKDAPVKRDVVVHIEAYRGTEPLEQDRSMPEYTGMNDSHHLYKEMPDLSAYLDTLIASWGYDTANTQVAQTSSCITLDGVCSPVGPATEFMYQKEKTLTIRFYFRYRGASAYPYSIDIDNIDGKPMWSFHKETKYWDRNFPKYLEWLHKQMISGK